MRRTALVVLFLVPACAATDDPSMGEEAETSDPSSDPSTDELEASAPEWLALGLVIRNTDVSWTDSAGTSHRVVSGLSEVEEASARAELENVPKLFFAWSDGMGRMNLEVRVVDDTVTRISQIGEDSFWVGPADVADILDTPRS